jgi:hypothetical protein
VVSDKWTDHRRTAPRGSELEDEDETGVGRGAIRGQSRSHAGAPDLKFLVAS